MSLVVSLTEAEYRSLHRQVIARYEEGTIDTENTARNIFVALPSKDLHLMLTGYETQRLYDIMEEADNEIKSLQMLALFGLQ